MKKLNVVIVCGGMSGEHEISLLSAYSIFKYIDRNQFEPLLLAINKKGQFVTHDWLILEPDSPRHVKLNPNAVRVSADFSNLPFNPDVIFPIIHGTFGEDGCLQGFLRIMDIPFVGADVFASALCMNKSATKKILLHAGIPISKFVELTKHDDVDYGSITKQLGDVLFIKPNALGSSVGITKCSHEKEFKKAVEFAFRFDNKILIEENYAGREIEFALMGNDEIVVSPPGEIVPDVEFYSYDSKYDPDSKTELKVPAVLDPDTLNRMSAGAKKAYKATECEGFCRIDFFLKKNGEFVINEINTLPGFTKISMFPALFQHAGFSYSEIITRLIEYGIQRNDLNKQLDRVYINADRD